MLLKGISSMHHHVLWYSSSKFGGNKKKDLVFFKFEYFLYLLNKMSENFLNMDDIQ